jgi:hypothetical protein
LAGKYCFGHRGCSRPKSSTAFPSSAPDKTPGSMPTEFRNRPHGFSVRNLLKKLHVNKSLAM